jgi:hypothetical protein
MLYLLMKIVLYGLAHDWTIEQHFLIFIDDVAIIVFMHITKHCTYRQTKKNEFFKDDLFRDVYFHVKESKDNSCDILFLFFIN